jgi:hypothetical protein
VSTLVCDAADKYGAAIFLNSAAAGRVFYYAAWAVTAS